MDTSTALSITSTATGHETLNFSVTLSTGERAVIMSIDDFNHQYFEMVREKIGPLFQRVISNLIKSRDYLGLQLNFEFGNIGEKEFDQLELDFITEPEKIDSGELKTEIEILVRLTNRVFNSEEISTMFNCSIETAEEAMNLLLGEN